MPHRHLGPSAGITTWQLADLKLAVSLEEKGMEGQIFSEQEMLLMVGSLSQSLILFRTCKIKRAVCSFLIKNFLLRYNSHTTKFHPSKKCNSAVSSRLIELYNHGHCLIPEHLHHLIKKPHTHQQSVPICPISPAPGNLSSAFCLYEFVYS